MMATAHSLVAGAIVSRIGDPRLALPLTFVSHFILDSIPHWDFGTNWRKRTKEATGIVAIIDTIIGFTLTWLLYATNTNQLLLASALVVSVLPDWMEAPWYMFFADAKRIGPKPNAGILEKLTYGVYKITNKLHAKAPFPWGFVTQILTVTFFLLLLQ